MFLPFTLLPIRLLSSPFYRMAKPNPYFSTFLLLDLAVVSDTDDHSLLETIFFSWLCVIILFTLYFSNHKVTSLADSSFSNQRLKVGITHSSILSLSCFPHSIFYIQETQLIFMALNTIYRPMTTKLHFSHTLLFDAPGSATYIRHLHLYISQASNS